MIDKELHKSTKYRIPKLREQFSEMEKEIGSYILLEENWDSFDAYIKKDIELFFTPQYRHAIDGKYTIADRQVGLVHSKDIMNKKFHSLKNIHKFLDEAFYKHKWKF